MQHPKTWAAAAALGLAALGVQAAPVTYTFDTGHSRIMFYVIHADLPNSVGEFKVGAGTFTVDNDYLTKSTVDVKVPVQSLELGDAKWNAHTLTADFLEAAKYPGIEFVSRRIERLAGGKGTLYGDLTIKGITKPVALDLKVNRVGEHPLRKTPAAGFTATTTVKRSDFGVTAYVPVVADNVKIRIEVEAFVPPKT